MRDDRCRIGSARVDVRQILRTDFCVQGCYSSIDDILSLYTIIVNIAIRNRANEEKISVGLHYTVKLQRNGMERCGVITRWRGIQW